MSYKVLQINSVCGIGSTGRIAVDIHRALIERGNESVIAYGRNSAPSDIPTIKIGGSFDQKLHGLKTRLLDKHGLGSAGATRRFVREMDDYSPDIIHLHNIHGYYINIKVLFNYIKERRVPVVWTFHDNWPITGHCSYFGDCDKWKTGCFDCEKIHEYPKSFYDDSARNYYFKEKIFTGTDKMVLVSPSQWLADILKESYLGDYPVKVINNGIDLNVFYPRDREECRRKYGFLPEDKIVLGVATLFMNEERKGLRFFIEMARKMTDYKFVLVGIEKEKIKDLPNNVYGYKRVDNAAMLAEFYSLADVFCNPTLEDNYPTVNMEALACGTPVIAFDTGGIKEQLSEDVGRLVRKGHLEGLIGNIRTAEFDREKCADYAAINFDKGLKYLEYIDLYEKMIEGI